MSEKTELIVALDNSSIEEARRVVDGIREQVDYFKVGSELFTAAGPEAVAMLKEKKCRVFLDLKFHDIPNTVAKACLNSLRLGVDMVNVHASGGREMLETAVQSVRSQPGGKECLILGVTVLTSLDRGQLNMLGVNRSVKNQVIYLARLCRDAGLNGVVCSGREIKVLKRLFGKEFVLVVPGIRPPTADLADQKRVITPKDAAALGADYIVVGRPITASPDPAKSAAAILAELG